QVQPQLIPAGLLVTVPLPLPVMLTVSRNCWVKMALTLRACVRLTVHGPVPVQSPLQWSKRAPEAGVGVSVTLVPKAKGALHAGPQLIPGGLEVTVPLPVPSLLTIRVNCGLHNAGYRWHAVAVEDEQHIVARRAQIGISRGHHVQTA